MTGVGKIRTVVLAAALLVALALVAVMGVRPASADHGGVRVHPGQPLGFGVVCDPVHEVDNVDPILDTNQTHIHAFDGGGKDLDITANTTPSDLRASTTSCLHSADKALYWTPKANSEVQTQVNYYQPQDETNPTGYKAFPANLEMIAGAKPMDGSTTVPSSLRFGCQSTPPTSSRPIDCGDQRFKVHIEFPDCVKRDADGSLRTTSANGRDHVYYSTNAGACSGNDLKIPRLKQHWIYQEHNGNNIDWSVPWYDLHADFQNGWNTTTMQNIIDICINGNDSGCQRITN